VRRGERRAQVHIGTAAQESARAQAYDVHTRSSDPAFPGAKARGEQQSA
jgi:hypothetical protein